MSRGMTNEEGYYSAERIILLLVLLSNPLAPEGYIREEIYAAISGYDACVGSGKLRTLERDLSFLERMGFTLIRTRHGRMGGTQYVVLHPENILQKMKTLKAK